MGIRKKINRQCWLAATGTRQLETNSKITIRQFTHVNAGRVYKKKDSINNMKKASVK